MAAAAAAAVAAIFQLFPNGPSYATIEPALLHQGDEIDKLNLKLATCYEGIYLMMLELSGRVGVIVRDQYSYDKETEGIVSFCKGLYAESLATITEIGDHNGLPYPIPAEFDVYAPPPPTPQV